MNGIHAIIEANGPISALSANALLNIMTRAATSAGATILQSHLHEFGETFGHTGVLLLAESHISVHTWPEQNYAAFDIFMCGEPKLQRAISILESANPGGSFHIKTIKRGRNQPATSPPTLLASQTLEQTPKLVAALQQKLALPKAELYAGFAELVKFLQLCSESKLPLPPSQNIALFWQTFLLFTQEYHDFCHRYLTKFIHHSPALYTTNNTEHTQQITYQQTLDLYTASFGTPNPQFWAQAPIKIIEHAIQ